ncbi:hypothetical protein [Streptomyces diastatochromogenes]|uniref:Uncharacterized protein n=1 Tax=Streptomyces diastatochromogenes TaxID=42236 RepID=A0A233S4Z7_STRDA|nr:hypothetical protein [Streptomyces diastatochromogenes]OXY90679.1 hypothetical protein BEK98_32705 [Streptomyces diastatochromogenes]
MDINHLPAGITIPAAVTKAQAALDKLWDAYGDAQIEYADALGEGWQERAQARDAAAAKAAVLAGKPAPKSTEIARVTAMRGTALGVIEAYEQQIRAAGAVVHRAWAASMPEVREQVVSALKAAESDYDEAVNRFYAARGAVRRAVSALAAVDHMERGRPGNAPAFTERHTDDFTLVQFGRAWLADHRVSVDPGDIVKVRVHADEWGTSKVVKEFPAEDAERFIAAGIAERV